MATEHQQALLTSIRAIQTHADWIRFFRARPEVCEHPDRVTDSDGKYLLQTEGFVGRSTTDLLADGIITDEIVDAWRDAARRVAQHQLEEEAKLAQRTAQDARDMDALQAVIRQAFERGDPRVTLSKSGQTIVFATDALGMGRRDLAGYPERARQQLCHAGLM